MAGRQIHEESLEGASAQDNMVGKFVHEISARHSTDKKGCFVYSAVLLPGGRLAVVDRNNWCVKLFDLEARKLTGKVVLSSKPWDITAIGEDRLTVVFDNPWYLDNPAYGDENKQYQFENKGVEYLQLLRVKPKLARSITLPLPGHGYEGVTCQGDKLYLNCRDPRSIQIFNLHGTLHIQINVENNVEDWLFGFPVSPDDDERFIRVPFSIAVSPDGAHIYVRERNKVACLTMNGQEVWTFSCRGVLFGMDLDKLARLFVCGLNPPITVLSSAGRQGTLLLDKEVRYPWAVAVGDGRMYLGGVDNKISVFRLEAADSARQLQYVCEDLPTPVDQSMNLSGDISLRDNSRDTESYRLPGSNRPDVRLDDIEEEPPVKLPKFE